MERLHEASEVNADGARAARACARASDRRGALAPAGPIEEGAPHDAAHDESAAAEEEDVGGSGQRFHRGAVALEIRIRRWARVVRALLLDVADLPERHRAGDGAGDDHRAAHARD